MKKIFLSIIAVASLVACTNDEVISYDKQAIAFTNAFVDNATRAADNFTITKDGANNTLSLGDFYVYGNTDVEGKGTSIVPIFEGVLVEKSGNDWNYSSQYTQYWIEGNKYNFAAIKNADENGVTVVNGLPTAITYTYNAAAEKDLLYAATPSPITGLATGNGKVAFTFNHLLSKVHFTLNNQIQTDNANYSVRISDIAINRAVGKAVYNVAGTEPATKWAAVEGVGAVTIEKLSFSDATPEVLHKSDTDKAKTSDYAHLLIPHVYPADAKLNITCKIETLLGDAVIDTNNYSNDIQYTFLPGHAYNFVLTITDPGDPIQFTVENVNGWETNHNGYNPGIGI